MCPRAAPPGSSRMARCRTDRAGESCIGGHHHHPAAGLHQTQAAAASCPAAFFRTSAIQCGSTRLVPRDPPDLRGADQDIIHQAQPPHSKRACDDVRLYGRIEHRWAGAISRPGENSGPGMMFEAQPHEAPQLIEAQKAAAAGDQFLPSARTPSAHGPGGGRRCGHASSPARRSSLPEGRQRPRHRRRLFELRSAAGPRAVVPQTSCPGRYSRQVG